MIPCLEDITILQCDICVMGYVATELNFSDASIFLSRGGSFNKKPPKMDYEITCL
jgi:hypothetical protein